MDKENRGEELNQISRLLFDKGSVCWYWGVSVEFFVGLVTVIITLLFLPLGWNIFWAIIGLIGLILSYYLKYQFSNIYDTAETMRRQSVLTEALDWPISKVQFSKWRLKAGKKILDTFKLKGRNKDYYETDQKFGPKKLLEMTFESAFWTRHLYVKIRRYIVIILVISVAFAVLVIMFAPLPFLSIDLRLKIIYFIYLFLPIILSIDVLGWLLRINKLITSIEEIELDLEKLGECSEIKTEEVMRLVSEYNCQVVNGFPIPNWFFKLQYDHITELWRLNK